VARWTQYIGLHPKAREYVKGAKVLATFKGTEGIAGEPVTYSLFEVPFTYDFYGEEMTDWRTYVEVTQAIPWSSGPMIFTCLVDVMTGKKMFEWTKEEIERY
jgi:hypothetical protein